MPTIFIDVVLLYTTHMNATGCGIDLKTDTPKLLTKTLKNICIFRLSFKLQKFGLGLWAHCNALCECVLMPYPSIGPKLFWTVQIVLVGSKLFWSDQNRFGWFQIILVKFKLDFSRLNFHNLDLAKLSGTRPKLFGWSKIIWTHRRTKH